MASLEHVLAETEERSITLRGEQCARIIAALWHAEKADPGRFPRDRTQQIMDALHGKEHL